MITATPDVSQHLINEPGTDLPDRLTGRHFPSQKMPQESSKDPRLTKKCRVCYAKGGPMKTVYIYVAFVYLTRGYILIFVLSYIILC